ncbi:hypothetical protein NEPAR08_2471 [Nematocida parisii]|nr:hypothetical protein NEPAR08_2471 [Nematocida parisii]KAI5151633.1 hypothetical protein ENBRE01_2275 [Enteropsectra breve]
MPLEAAGCTRATVRAGGERREAREQRRARDARLEARAERGIPSMRGSPARGDSVPVLCTHRPSLSEMGRRGQRARAGAACPRLDKSRNKVSVGEPAEGSSAEREGARRARRSAREPSGDPSAVRARKGAAHAKGRAGTGAPVPECAARAGPPAGLKHISTRRRRNEDGFPE